MSEDNAVSSEQLADLAVKGMQEKKARQVVKLDLRGIDGAIADFFVICHGDSDRQVDAIAGSVEEEIRKATKEKPFSREGFQQAEWILLDYIDVVVHIFQQEKREFFGIEALWGDGKRTEYEDVN